MICNFCFVISISCSITVRNDQRLCQKRYNLGNLAHFICYFMALSILKIELPLCTRILEYYMSLFSRSNRLISKYTQHRDFKFVLKNMLHHLLTKCYGMNGFGYELDTLNRNRKFSRMLNFATRTRHLRSELKCSHWPIDSATK